MTRHAALISVNEKKKHFYFPIIIRNTSLTPDTMASVPQSIIVFNQNSKCLQLIDDIASEKQFIGLRKVRI